MLLTRHNRGHGLSTAPPNREEGEPIPHLIVWFLRNYVFADNNLTLPRGRLPFTAASTLKRNADSVGATRRSYGTGKAGHQHGGRTGALFSGGGTGAHSGADGPCHRRG